ncbi:hypothetical protein PybrP1_008241 [[Pythium] brassicae (nom. inval.)]|nr:hypothetical protein PybrP1_008241 [[Pythium] brassicae (nom. inval.)]
MVRVFLALSASVALLSHAAVTLATKVTFINKCGHTIELYDNARTENIAKGGSIVRELGAGFTGMFRHGANPEANLAEFSVVGASAWFDISAIPPGPGNCKSFGHCKAATGKKGFNVPMAITPKIASGVRVPKECRALVCEAEGCTDAYLFPSDDLKTHNCPSTGVEFTVAFCPNGQSTGSSTSTTAASQSPAATKAATSNKLSEIGKDYQSGVVTAGTSAPASDPVVTAASGNTTSLVGATIKSSFSYKGVLAGNVPGSYNMVTNAASCTKQAVAVNSPVGPLSEEVSLVFRGPMEIHNIAVFTAAPGASGDWTKVSSFSDSGESDNILFLNNLNVDYSGGNKSPQGFAGADGARKAAGAGAFSGKLAEASNPSNKYGGPGVATGAEVNIMLPKKCSADSACKGYYDDNGYHGWDGGKKMFVTKVRMPMGSAPNQPAIWMLNAQVLRSNQYGCNCRGMGAVGGCGELDIAEVIETNAARDKVTTHYYFYDGKHPAGADNFAARPTDAATTYVTIIDDAGEGAIKVLEVGGDDFDFGARSISAATIATWLSASDKNLLHSR